MSVRVRKRNKPCFGLCSWVLGTPAPSLDRLGPSTLVEAGVEKLIFDVGRGVYVRLNQLGVAFPDITGILFTHLHSDHVWGCLIYG